MFVYSVDYTFNILGRIGLKSLSQIASVRLRCTGVPAGLVFLAEVPDGFG
jgi:hypothetical protein